MSKKKGFVCSSSDPLLAKKVKDLNVSWYYTWSYTDLKCAANFVPMIWGKKQLPFCKSVTGDTLLTFNEPDRPDQANMSVEDAASYWSTLQKTGKRLGSPASSSPALTPGGWFEKFMIAIDCKVDFIAIHWYAPPNPTGFLNLLDNLYAKYKLPIWITEFAVADWKAISQTQYSVDQVKTFMKTVVPELEKRNYIEKYAWKTRNVSDPFMGTSALFNADGSLTELGKLYASL